MLFFPHRSSLETVKMAKITLAGAVRKARKASKETGNMHAVVISVAGRHCVHYRRTRADAYNLVDACRKSAKFIVIAFRGEIITADEGRAYIEIPF